MSDDFQSPREQRGFGTDLIQAPLTALPVHEALVFCASDTVTDAMRAMQREHTGCVLVTRDGTRHSKLVGIFTERDVLFRIVDRGKNPATLPLSEVMTPEPEVLTVGETVAYALKKMSISGFCHVPVVDGKGHPAFVVSVRDIVEFLVEAFPRQVLNLPAERAVAQKSREGA